MTLVRHTSPCDDPACQPCWWDALDREMYATLPPPRLTFTQRLRQALRKPFAVRHDPPRWEDR